MFLISQNPFRVLGLLANSSERELQKQIAIINRYAEVGKTKSFDYDFEILGPISRTPSDVSKASSQIEQAKNKLGHSLFWFINKSHIDETAINHLKDNNPDKAIEIWEKTIKNGKVTPANFSSVSNLSTLLLAQAFQTGSINKQSFSRAITLKGDLIKSDVFDSFVRITAGESVSLDASSASQLFTETILSFSEKDLDKPGGLTTADLIKAFENFHESATKFLNSALIEDRQTRVDDRIENSKSLRKESPEKANEFGGDLFHSTNPDLGFLSSVFGSDNVQYQILANKVANEILQCAIDYFNEWQNDSSNDPGQESLRVANLAKRITTGGHVQERIDENIENIQEWVDDAPERKRLNAVQKEVDLVATTLATFQEATDSISTARSLITNCKPALDKMKTALGPSDEFYLRISTAVASNALGMIVTVVNHEQNRLKITPQSAIDSLKRTLPAALTAVNEIGKLDMEPEARSHYNQNRQTLSSVSNSFNQAMSRQQGSGSGCLTTIGGWIGVLFVLSLVGSCMDACESSGSSARSSSSSNTTKSYSSSTPPSTPVTKTSSKPKSNSTPKMPTARKPEKSTPPYSSTFDDDDYVTVGEYRCSRYHSNQLDTLRPSAFEESTLNAESNRINAAGLRIQLSTVNEYSSQYEIDEYNRMVDEYNADLRSYKLAENRYNDKVNAYNTYLTKYCSKVR